MAGFYTLLGMLAAVTLVQGHSYHLGSCPTVDPLHSFDMDKFLGKWYVIQKTSTGSKCLTNSYVKGAGTNNYTLEQTSEHLILGLTSVDHQYRYTGTLTAKETSVPAKMTVRFPLSVAGSASYVVFMTDYENYAGVFTCQKLTFAHRQSASILSRRPTLDKIYLDKVRAKLASFNVDPFTLSIIEHTDCPTGEGYDINIDPNTFSAGNIAGVVRTAGEKIGDGIEAVAGGAKRVYNSYGKDREELSDTPATSNTEAEWLP